MPCSRTQTGLNGDCTPYHPIRSRSDHRKTCPCNEYPLKPHFSIEELGCGGVIPILFLFCSKHRLWVHVRTSRIYVLEQN